jgi:hypothetical protein
LRHTAQRLYSLPAQVVAGRMYVLLLRGTGSGVVHVVRRDGADPRMATVMAAKVENLGELPRRLVDALSTLPADRATDAILSILQDSCPLSPRSDGPTLAPATARAAFGLPLVELDEDGAVRACVVSVCALVE